MIPAKHYEMMTHHQKGSMVPSSKLPQDTYNLKIIFSSLPFVLNLPLSYQKTRKELMYQSILTTGYQPVWQNYRISPYYHLKLVLDSK